jgi:hypothetical protein
MMSLPIIRAATGSRNAMRTGGTWGIRGVGWAATASRTACGWDEQQASRLTPGPRCSTERTPSPDARATSIPFGR